MRISVITLFPGMFAGPFEHSIVKRAIDSKLIKLNFVDLRNFGIGKHKTVDDTPYGGGRGMVLRVDVLKRAIDKARLSKSKKKEKVILLSAHGRKFNYKVAKDFSKLDHLIIICGHYEGFDERIKNFVDEEISVGDFILTGGEIPAMLIIDSVSRLIKNVIKNASASNESFPLLEHPHYTKPREYSGVKVPNVLVSGNHKEIDRWREDESVKITKKLRPDLIKSSKRANR